MRFAASRKLNIADIAASTVTITSGMLYGRRGSTKNPGGNRESAVVIWAVQSAPTGVEPLRLAPVGVQVTAAPRFVLPFLNCTVPVGPWTELLCEFTVAVSVTFPPDATLLRFDVTASVVAACVMVTARVLLVEFEL